MSLLFMQKAGWLCIQHGGSCCCRPLTWLKSERNIRTWVKETGFTSSFCQNCGSLVPNILRQLECYWVPVGTLEDGPYAIVANLYLDSKASWAVVSPTGERYETMPRLDDFIQLLGNGLHDY